MKKSFLVIAILLLFTQGVYPQMDAVLKKQYSDQTAAIDKIIKEKKANLKSYTKTLVMNDSTGSRYNYKKGKELQLVSINSADKQQNLTKTVEWYFHNGQLIYAEQNYKVKGSNNIIDTEKFYLNKEQLFAWFQGGKWKDINSSEFKQVSDGLHAYATQLKADSIK